MYWVPDEPQTPPLNGGGQGILGLICIGLGVILIILGTFDVLSGPLLRGVTLIVVGVFLAAYGRRDRV